MVQSCFLCGNKSNKTRKISVHRFPDKIREHVIQKKWVEVCGIDQDVDTSKITLCSLHFQAPDYYASKVKQRLKPDSVPSVRVPHPPQEVGCADKENIPHANNECHDFVSEDIEIDTCLPSEGDISEHGSDNGGSDQGIRNDAMRASPCKVHTNETCSDAGERVTPRNQLSTTPRYVSEIITPDVANPRRAGHAMKLAKVSHRRKAIEVKRLQLVNHRLSSRIMNLRKRVNELEGRKAQKSNSNKSQSADPEMARSDEALQYNLGTAETDLRNLGPSGMPPNWLLATNANGINLLYVGDNLKATPVSRSILVRPNMTLEIRIMNNVTKSLNFGRMESVENIVSAMGSVAKLRRCVGIDDICHGEGFLPDGLRTISERCRTCGKARKRVANRQYYERVRLASKKKEEKSRCYKNLKRKFERLQKNMEKTREEVTALKQQCAQVSETAVNDAIRNLEKTQQEAVRACLSANKCKGPSGVRYTDAWVLECLLLRIKSRKAYQHLRNQKILALPNFQTLNTYIKNLKASYGFADETFKLLREKADSMSPEDRRGTIIIDEMELIQGVSFDPTSVDLGEHTPAEQRGVRGDHALVFLFQPVRGNWTQSVGSFLTKSCASNKILHKMILECIILMENCGFYVDVVTTGGATWDRAIRKEFGLQSGDNSCEHPCSSGDENRRLFFPPLGEKFLELPDQQGRNMGFHSS